VIRKLPIVSLLGAIALLAMASPGPALAADVESAPPATKVQASGPAGAPTGRATQVRRTIRVVSTARRGKKFLFKVKHLRSRRIVSARLRAGRLQRKLKLRRMQRAARLGHLRVSPVAADLAPAAGTPARASLFVTTVQVVPPKPTPTPAPPVGSCAFGSFGVGSWPGACWRPYSDSSPFNRRLPAAPLLDSRSDAIVRTVTALGKPDNLVAGNADSADDWGHPTYYSSAADPEFTVACIERWGRCDLEGERVRIPDAARPAAGGDGHMTVIDQQSGWEYDMWQVRSKPRGGGRIEISWGGRTRIDGDGLGSDATAARFGNLAGIIRAEEWAAGDINHALFMTINCDSGAHVYPASKAGRPCSEVGKSIIGAAPMGTRFQLAMSDQEIAALPVPTWKKTLLTAMAHYGMYFGDTGGSSWGLQVESGSTYTSFGQEDALATFAKSQGVPTWQGDYVFDVKSGVDWESRLRVVAPCEASGTC
jgi:hypothetical protein